MRTATVQSTSHPTSFFTATGKTFKSAMVAAAKLSFGFTHGVFVEPSEQSDLASWASTSSSPHELD